MAANRRKDQRNWPEETKREALRLSDEVGPAEAARRLGVPEGTPRWWRVKAGQVGTPAGQDPEAVARKKREAAAASFSVAAQGLRHAADLLDRGRFADAVKAATVAGILWDESAIFEQAAERQAERQAQIDRQVAQQVVDLVGQALEDVGLPAIDSVKHVLAARLRGDVDAAAAELARRELTEAIGRRFVSEQAK